MSTPYRPGFGFAIAGTLLVFFAMGLLFLPRLGFEYDEVTFCHLVFHPRESLFAARIHHHFVPLMQMSYVGALKIWLYWPLLKVWKAGVYSVRLPVLTMGSATIFLLAHTLRRTASVRAAIFIGALLASDVSFLLAETFDWGPVAVQNLLLSIALYWLLAKRKIALGLPIAAFALGLATWDKAIFVWILSGLCLSGVVFGARNLTRLVTVRRLTAASIAFSIGISPLIIYNLKRRNQTLGNGAHFAFSELGPKLKVVELALNGQAFREFFADPNAPIRSATDQKPAPRFIPNPSSWRCLSFALLLVGGIACARWQSRALILWLTCAVVIAWLQSAITKDAGTFVHHLVIFYPVLFLALGFAAEEIAEKLGANGTLGLAVVGVLLCGAGLNAIYVQFRNLQHFSPTTFWTDADEALAEYFLSHPARQILVGDWGIASQLDLRTASSLPINEICFRLKDGDCKAQEAQEWAQSSSLIVMHAPGHQMFLNQERKLAQLAKATGLAVRAVTTINDRGGHPMFEIDQLAKPTAR